MVFPVVMYGCESWTMKKSWAPKNWCFWTVVLEKILESPLDSKEIKPVHPKGDQSWIFTGWPNSEAETPKLWPPDVKKLTHWKRPWCWERLKVGWEENNRGCPGWMTSPTQWTWVWVSSGSRCWTRRAGMLQLMGLQSWTQVRDWTELKKQSRCPLALNGCINCRTLRQCNIIQGEKVMSYQAWRDMEEPPMHLLSERSLKRLHSLWFQLCDMLEKAKLWRQ